LSSAQILLHELLVTLSILAYVELLLPRAKLALITLADIKSTEVLSRFVPRANLVVDVAASGRQLV
jgi:hypothetical protein